MDNLLGGAFMAAIAIGLLSVLAGALLMFSTESERWPRSFQSKLMLAFVTLFCLSMGVFAGSFLFIAGEMISRAWSAL